MRSDLKAAVPAMALAVAMLVPFLAKPLHVDDPLFVWQAEHVASGDWRHPTAFSVNWDGTVRRLSTIFPTGPLYPLMLAALSKSLVAMRLLQIAWIVVGIWGVARLARRLGLDGRTAALVYGSTPAVLCTATQLLPDVASGVLALWAVDALAPAPLAGGGELASDSCNSRPGPGRAVAGAVLLAAAILARTNAVALVAVLAVALWRRPLSAYLDAVWPLAAASALALAGLAATADPLRPAGMLASMVALFRAPNIPLVGAAMIASWASTTALPAALLLTPSAGERSVRRDLVVGAVFTVLGAVVLAAFLPRSPLWPAVTVGVGAAALAGEIRAGFRKGDAPRRLTTLWLLAPVVLVLYLHWAPKYLMVAAPAAGLIVAREIRRVRRNGRVLAGLVGAGALVSLLINHADYRLAALNPRAADLLVRPHVLRGERVWIAAHWGFQYYAERAGAVPLDSRRSPGVGDLVVAGTVTDGADDLRRLGQVRAIAESVTDARPGLRTMSAEAGAGLYSSSWGILPVGWSRMPVETFAVYRIGRVGTPLTRPDTARYGGAPR